MCLHATTEISTFYTNLSFLQLEQKTPQINEKMLKTIRFKSSLCQKLEAELREKEDEIINTKTENFKLEKTVEFLQTNQNKQSQESEKDDSNATKNLEARLEYLEQMVSESKTEAISSSITKVEPVTSYNSLKQYTTVKPKRLIFTFTFNKKRRCFHAKHINH